MASNKLNLRYYEPIEAIVFYKSENNAIFPCSHGISKLPNGEYKILLPKQVSKTMIKNIYNDICGNNAVSSVFLPENLLYVGSDRIMWWGGDREQYKFNTLLHGEISFSIKDASLLFVYGPSIGFNVFLVEGTKRPSENTKIFDFPVYNSQNGSICLGTTKVPEFDSKNINSFIKKMTDVFFYSKFTSEGDEKVKQIWTKVAKTGVFDIRKPHEKLKIVNDLLILL
jgi:PRTRC genetic system protein B